MNHSLKIYKKLCCALDCWIWVWIYARGVPSKSNEIHILFKKHESILQDRSEKLNQKTSQLIYEKTENISNIFSDHNNIKGEISTRKTASTNTLRIFKQHFLNNKISNFNGDKWKWKYNDFWTWWDALQGINLGMVIAVQAYPRKQLASKTL